MIWSVLNGTIVNTATVAVGSLVGVAVSGRLPERYRVIVLQCLGLVTITLGINSAVIDFGRTIERFRPPDPGGATYGARLAMVMIASLVVGSLLGTLLRLHDRIEALGGWIHRRWSGGGDAQRFAEGFLSASVIFCVGPLTLLGCLRNGASADPSFLYIKACLDGFCSIALAATFGWGVMASVLTVLGLQGGLSLLAWQVSEPLDPLSLEMMNVVGGVVLLATAMMILEIKRIRVADMCPGLFLPPLVIRAVELVSPGLLMTG